MDSREKVTAVFKRKSTGVGAMWTGHLSEKTIPVFAEAYGVATESDAIYNYLGDDCRWVIADAGYKHPERLLPLDPAYGINRKTLSAEGCFANAETVADIEKYPWPDLKYLDFTGVYAAIDSYKGKKVFSGMWSCFYHNIADFFGMENYFIKMYENPTVVDAVTERVVDYYVAANELFFRGLGDREITMFFGNDFGTQLNLFIAPENFRRFILPSIKRIISIGKKYGKTIMLHSCGSIYRVIPDLIESGIDVLHPIQAKARGMDAKSLVQYKNDLAFVGGIDAQSFFVNATPTQIKDEVRRVYDILGPNIVISPSHEEILPIVPPANILAMAEAAHEINAC